MADIETDADGARGVLVEALATGDAGLATALVRGSSFAGGDVSRIEFTESLAAQVASDVRAWATSVAGKRFIPYDPSYQTDASQVLVERLAEVLDLAGIDAQVRGGDLADDAASDGAAPVMAMVHAVGSGTTRLVAYRLKGPGIATQRARRGLALVPRDGIFEPYDREILFYEPRFDALTCGDFVFFTAASLIQRALNSPEKAQQLARDALKAATAKLKIHGLEELEEAVVNDPVMRAKMAQVGRLLAGDEEYASFLTTENLIAFADGNPAYELQVTEIQGERLLSFDPSPQRRYQIPKLLADDYLRSQLTERAYEAGSKHRV